MPVEKISIYVVWIVLIVGIIVGCIVSDLVQTPESQAMEQCHTTCGYHGVQSYTPTTGCLCRD